MAKLPIKLVISAVSLAFALSGPAEAANRKHHAHAAPKTHLRAAGTQPAQSTAVYYGSKYLGSDPDPRIRHELQRDLGAAFGGDN